jgi:hypothetical protein
LTLQTLSFYNGYAEIIEGVCMRRIIAVLAVFTVGTFSLTSVSAGSATIENTGPDSENKISISWVNGVAHFSVDNDTDIDVDNDTDQEATTGDATVKKNTDAGDAETGDAENDNALVGTIAVANSGSDCGVCAPSGGDVDASIDTTGPDSENVIHIGGGSDHKYRVDNDTKIKVNNDTDQDATSGDATVYKNTTGGDATTGDASNSNETDVEVTVTNDTADFCDCWGNSSDVDASIDTTGPDSTNVIHVGSGSGGNVHVDNDTNVQVHNDTTQTATTGSATVSHNTTGGSASTGGSSNSNSTSFNLSVQN